MVHQRSFDGADVYFNGARFLSGGATLEGAEHGQGNVSFENASIAKSVIKWGSLNPAGPIKAWASWYAQWLIDLSELSDLLGARPVRSELIYMLVSLDKQFTAEAPSEPWEIYYARQILRHFQPSRS